MLINSCCSARDNGCCFAGYMNMTLFFVYSSSLHIDRLSHQSMNTILSTCIMMYYLTFKPLCAIKHLDFLVLRSIGLVLISFYFVCLTNVVTLCNQLRQSICSIFYPLLLKVQKDACSI